MILSCVKLQQLGHVTGFVRTNMLVSTMYVMLPALASQSGGTDHELVALGNENTCINDGTGFMEVMPYHSTAP